RHLRHARGHRHRRLHHPGPVRRGRAACGRGAPAGGGAAAAGGGWVTRRGPAAATGLLFLGLAGLAVGPTYQRPPGPVPPQFYGQEGALAEARSLADLTWWELFEAPVLESLIDEALRRGFDARLAAARVEEARALYGVARGDLFPGVAYQGGWERQ